MADARCGSVANAVVAALTGSSSAVVAGHLNERSLLHLPGHSGLAGDYEGRAAICALLDRMNAATAGSLRFELLSTTVAGVGRVRLCGTLSGGRGQRSLETAATLETAISEDLVREAWLSCADQPAWDAFWD